MNARRDAIRARAVSTAVASATAVALCCGSANAASPTAGRWFSVGALAGTWVPDGSLSDYQWNAMPQPAWGIQALGGASRWAAGLRLWSATTSQDLGSSAPSPDVRSTTAEVVGRARLGSWWGTEVAAIASTGVLHLGWNPDHVTLDAGGTPVEVAFESVTEWIGGGGLALRRPIGPSWALGLEVDHRVFALDTAHQSGGSIVRERESFGEWNARLELAWLRGSW